MNDRRQKYSFSSGLSKRASVFVFLCVFAVVLMGCGIPQWFYVYDSTTDYIWSFLPHDDKSYYTFKLNFTESAASSLSKVHSETSPSIMLFYIIDDVVQLSNSSSIISAFRTTYKLSGAGASLSASSEDGSVLSVTDSSDSSVKYKLFPFQLDKKVVGNPGYLINPGPGSLGTGDKTSLSAYLEMNAYNYDPDDTTVPKRSFTLYKDSTKASSLGAVSRWNGEDFYFRRSDIDSLTDIEKTDYNLITGGSADDIYLHIFATFNVSPTVSADAFNNIFWGTLQYVGSIKLTP